MGGTGSYDPYRSTGGSSPGLSASIDCGRLSILATVQLPPEPIDVTPGDVLEVLLVRFDGGAPIVGVVDADGHLVGSIVDHLKELFECLSKGVAFIAQVLSVEHDIPSVRVVAADTDRVLGPATLDRRAGSGLDEPITLTLVPETSDTRLDARVALKGGSGEATPVVHARYCELRALIRVGVRFSVRPQAGSSIEITGVIH